MRLEAVCIVTSQSVHITVLHKVKYESTHSVDIILHVRSHGAWSVSRGTTRVHLETNTKLNCYLKTVLEGGVAS